MIVGLIAYSDTNSSPLLIQAGSDDIAHSFVRNHALVFVRGDHALTRLAHMTVPELVLYCRPTPNFLSTCTS